jgi:hypothetical protein
MKIVYQTPDRKPETRYLVQYKYPGTDLWRDDECVDSPTSARAEWLIEYWEGDNKIVRIVDTWEEGE